MITSIQLYNYRSFDDLSLEFEPSVNIIIGPNASGKTNIIEAILVSLQGRSYKSVDSNLINNKKEWARIEMLTHDNKQRTIKIAQDNNTSNKEMMIDGTTYKRLPQRHKLPVVLFEPDQLQNINKSPELRRSLLDDLLEQIEPDFAKTKRDYYRTLAQRNTLLKNPKQARETIFAWNIRLSELGAVIARNRIQLIEQVNEKLPDIYSEIAHNKHSIKIDYMSDVAASSYANDMLKQLEQVLEKDIERGFTTKGPHRDDVIFLLDDEPIKDVASRGEIRTTLLAFKIIEAKILEKKTHSRPVMLLDDVFGELDGQRRKILAEILKDYQAFITTTDADVVLAEFAKHTNTISLS